MQVGRTDHDSVDCLHFLKKDILKGVQHLCSRAIYILHPLAEDCISLVEEENRHFLLGLTEVAVDAEDSAYGFLAVSHPLALELGNINGEDISSGLLGKLESSFRLTGAGTAIEDDIEALAHAHLIQSLLDSFEMGVLKKVLQSSHLLLLRSVIVHLLLLYLVTAH